MSPNRARSILQVTLFSACALASAACKKSPAPVVDAGALDAAPVVLEVIDAAPPVVDAASEDAAAAHAHTGPLVIPGACVDPSGDAKGRIGGAPTVSSEPDLDGDGKADKILAFASPNATTFAVYVMRGTCGHFVGVLKSGTLVAEKAKSHGLAELHGNTPCKAKCNCTTQDFTARFNGTSYFQGAITENFVTCPPAFRH